MKLFTKNENLTYLQKKKRKTKNNEHEKQQVD